MKIRNKIINGKDTTLVFGNFLVKVDSEDVDKISKHSWHLHCDPKELKYRVVTGLLPRNTKKVLHLSRFLLKAKEGEIVDHINQDTLDNRKENLRITNRSVNALNGKTPASNTSGYRGVYFISNTNKRKKRWLARLVHDKKIALQKYFLTKEEAGFAYQQELRKYV